MPTRSHAQPITRDGLKTEGDYETTGTSRLRYSGLLDCLVLASFVADSDWMEACATRRVVKQDSLLEVRLKCDVKCVTALGTVLSRRTSRPSSRPFKMSFWSFWVRRTLTCSAVSSDGSRRMTLPRHVSEGLYIHSW